MKKLLKKFFRLFTENKVSHEQKSTKPCILTPEQTQGKTISEIVDMYEPAMINFGTYIPLKRHLYIYFPLSEITIAMIKNNLRFVWCDGFESKQWTERNCKYLGIRISESLVLHETASASLCSCGVELLRAKCHARLLSIDELKLLSFCWKEISDMRQMAGDTPLPPNMKTFWVERCGKRVLSDKYGITYLQNDNTEAAMLLAVTNSRL